MGDRICLTFVCTNEWGTEKSPVLYSHWAGMDLLDYASEFWDQHHEEIRSTPSNFMVNFISWLRQGKVADGEYYLYPDEESSCSPDDNGFWEFDTATGRYRRV